MNKNVSAVCAVIRAKLGTEPGVQKLLAKYQTHFRYKFRPTNGWHANRFFGVEFTNAKFTNATLVQLLALYTDPESHDAQRYRERD